MDVVANMLTSIKNASRAKKSEVQVPYSKFKAAIAKKLMDAGYIAGYEKSARGKMPTLAISLAYGKDGASRISDVRRVSKQSCRRYYRVKDIKPVKNGHGVLYLSTPKGVLAGDEARQQQVGGEALFLIW